MGARGAAFPGRGRPRILYAYAAREFGFSFFVAFLFFFVVFFVNQLLLMAEDILAKRAPFGTVLLLLLYATPSVVAMASPFAALVGGLMAAGRLASSNELLVIQASGIPSRRIFAPFAALGLVVSLVSFVMNDVFLPLGTIEFGKLYRELLVSSPAVELEAFAVRRYRDLTLVTGSVEGDTVRDILIFDKDPSGAGRVIAARSARLLPADDEGMSLTLVLEGVWTQRANLESPERFEYGSADEMEYRIELKGRGEAGTAVGPREMSSKDVWRAIVEKEGVFTRRTEAREREAESAREALRDAYAAAQIANLSWDNARSGLERPLAAVRSLVTPLPADRSLQLYRLEFYKKFSIPLGALCFVFLAYPLGLRARRAGKGVGFGLGLLIAVLYWALLLGGQTLGTRLGWSPFWSMWLPNFFVLLAGAAFWGWGAAR